MIIGKKLRKRRLEMGLSRNQLAARVHVTPSSIANYENGISYPKPDILISLILALDIDANYLYQDYLSNKAVEKIYQASISEEEKESIIKYRELPESVKRLVRIIIDEEYARVQKEEKIILPCWQPGVRKPYSGFLLQEKEQNIRLPLKNVPEGCEFCFQVQISLYEPIFHKGDVLALSSAHPGHNEIGIFQLNDVCYIRTLYQDGHICRLHSLNVMDPDIEIQPEDHFDYLGRVLGKINGEYELKDI